MPPRTAIAFRAAGSLLAAVLALCVSDCGGGGSGDSCASHDSTECTEGVTYWVDACGEREEEKERCHCGCTADDVDCEACECRCTEVSDCCDGCFPINWGGACEDGDAATADDLCVAGACMAGGPVIAPPAAPAEPAAPEPVALVSWTCPVSWSAVEHASLLDDTGAAFHWCEPPAVPRLGLDDGYITPLEDGEQEGDRPVCEPALDGSFPVLGQAACQPLGDACPAGEWPEVPAEVTGARIHVRLGAGGGDGSTNTPYGSIGEAVNRAAAGDVIVIGAGSYPESFVLDKDLTLWGACVTQTAIEAPGPYASDGAVIRVEADAAVTLRNLRLSGEQAGLRVESADASAVLEGVWLHAVTNTGIVVASGAIDIRGSLIEGTLGGDNNQGRGVAVEAGGRLVLASSTLERNRVVGLEVRSGGGTADLTDVVLRNTLGQTTGNSLGRGIDASVGATLTAERLLVHGNREAGISVRTSGTEAVLTDVIVRSTEANEASQVYGEGLWVESGAKATVTRGLFEDNRTEGVFVNSSRTSLELNDVIIRGTRSQKSSRLYGEGLWVQEGAGVTVTRALIEANRDAGIWVGVEGSTAVLDSVIVLDTQSEEADGGSGVGLWVESGGVVTGRRVHLERNRFIGLLSSQPEATIDLEDVTIRDTQPLVSDDQFGQGVQVSSGAQLTLRRALIERNHNYGVIVSNRGSSVDLEDVVVRDTKPQLSDDTAGGGMVLIIASQAVVRRGLFENNHTVGLVAWDNDTLLDLEDVTVRDTLAQVSDEIFGRGIEAQRGAKVVLRRGLLERNRSIGLAGAGRDSELQLEDVVVRDTLSEDKSSTLGYGLWITTRARASVVRGLFEGNRTAAVMVQGSGCTFEGEDLVVRTTQSEGPTLKFGYGMWADGGASMSLTRTLIEQNRTLGLGVSEAETTATLVDLAIRDTRPQLADGTRGLGLQVNAGATATIDGGWFDRNRTVAIQIYGVGSRLDMTDLVVRDTMSREATIDFGRGLGVAKGADLTVTRGLFQGNREISAGAWSAGSTLGLTDVVIRDTLLRECATDPDDPCPGYEAGLGLGVYQEGTVVVNGVDIFGSPMAGVQLAREGSITGDGLYIRQNRIGANIQEVPEGYDFFEAVEGLLMEDNEVNFDSTALEVPGELDEE